jgi:type II secretory pathway pseudopilin PulG
MRLAGQDNAAVDDPSARSGLDDHGYILVVLLVGMAIAAIWMSAALPAWRHQVQRQREDDLVFRGEQYARAIVSYQKKNQGVLPPDIDILVNQHYLRKKWKDPISKEDFFPVGSGILTPGRSGGAPAPAGQAPGSGQPGGQPGAGPGAGQPGAGQPTGGQPSQTPGITGVRSRSTATSIKIYRGQQQYNLWEFDARYFYGLMGYNPNPQQQGQPGRGQQPGRGGPADGRGAPGTGAPGVRPGPDGRGVPGQPPPPGAPGGRGRVGGGL